MPKRIPLIFFLIIAFVSLKAQDDMGCSYLLEDAKEAYSAGMVELVPELLLPCLESGELEGTAKLDAYKLVINAYLFDYLPVEADSLMIKFVAEFPDYLARDADPAEFILLHGRYAPVVGPVVDTLIVEQETGIYEGDDPGEYLKDLKQKRRSGERIHSLGFSLGVNGTLPLMVERYSLGDPSADQGHFGLEPGFQGGIVINLALGEVVETSFGLRYNHAKFSYKATPFTYTSYKYLETGQHLQLPVSTLIKLNPKSKSSLFYIRMGIVGDYLIASKGEGTRSFEESYRDVVVEKTDITASREQINMWVMAGVGLRIPFERAFFFMEADYSVGGLVYNIGESRYQNSDITWLLYHVDSDFILQQFAFSMGICWNLNGK